MSKTRDVLVHVSVETAAKKRKCHHNRQHSIAAGESCLVIRQSQNLGSKNYCCICAGEILSAAQAKLTGLHQNFRQPPPSQPSGKNG